MVRSVFFRLVQIGFSQTQKKEKKEKENGVKYRVAAQLKMKIGKNYNLKNINPLFGAIRWLSDREADFPCYMAYLFFSLLPPGLPQTVKAEKHTVL